MSQVISLQAKRKSPALSKKETEILLKINKGLPIKTRKRFGELNKKRQAETLTTSEHKELLSLIGQIEKSDSERIGHMAELARIRGISLTELMKESEIFPSAHG
jgi:predicted DNA-binding protein with PD1-like motif